MIPVLLLVGTGKRRRVWIPLPFFLLWPFWLLGWLVWLPVWVLRVRAAAALRQALSVVASLSGVRVDVDARDGTRIHIRFV